MEFLNVTLQFSNLVFCFVSTIWTCAGIAWMFELCDPLFLHIYLYISNNKFRQTTRSMSKYWFSQRLINSFWLFLLSCMSMLTFSKVHKLILFSCIHCSFLFIFFFQSSDNCSVANIFCIQSNLSLWNNNIWEYTEKWDILHIYNTFPYIGYWLNILQYMLGPSIYCNMYGYVHTYSPGLSFPKAS